MSPLYGGTFFTTTMRCNGPVLLLALGAWLAARGVKRLGGALAMQYLTLVMCLFGPVFYGHGRYGWPLLFCWPVLLAAAVCAARRQAAQK